MRILLSSYAFLPSVGGLENVSAMLAEQFAARGHEVVVITQTPADSTDEHPYRVVRQPGMGLLLRLVRWCDVFLHNNINVRSAWPLVVARRRWVVINQGSVTRTATGRLKRLLANFAIKVGVSRDAATKIGASLVVPNCYRDDLFRRLPDERRDGDLVFVGRLVTEKGVDVLLRAIRKMKGEGLVPRLTIIGDGPEAAKLRVLAKELEIDAQITWAGVRQGMDLVRELNRHSIQVVPSTYEEPFGIVALEGIACGCVLVGSERGGLIDAIGACGITFANGDAAALATCLETLLTHPEKLSQYRNQAAQHLSKFTRATVAEKYLSIMKGQSR